MTFNEKQKLIAEIVSLLQTKILEDTESSAKPEKREASKVEMLTIKECASAVKGLSEHTVR